MKKAIGLIFSGVIMLPAIALGASAVKTLGGAGTYSGITSIGSGTTGAKTGTRILRAGSVRTVPAVKSVSTISSSNTNSLAKSGTTTAVSGNNQNRMSIGKYLSGAGIVSSSSSSGSTSGAPSRRTDELEQDIQSLHDKLSDLEQAGYITSSDIDEYLKNADLNLDDYLTYAELDKKGFLTNDITNPYVKTNDLNTQVASQVTSELQERDLVTSEGLNTSLDGYVQKDTLELEKLAYRSYIDTIVDNLESAQAGLSQQIQNIQVSNMPEVPACIGGSSCTYMLMDNGTDTKTWKEMSVVDEFDEDQMN